MDIIHPLQDLGDDPGSLFLCYFRPLFNQVHQGDGAVLQDQLQRPFVIVDVVERDDVGMDQSKVDFNLLMQEFLLLQFNTPGDDLHGIYGSSFEFGDQVD